MTADPRVFLDANALVYALDQTSGQYTDAVARIQRLLDEGAILCTSHHVIEEVIHVARTISSASASEVVREISGVPDLELIEPDSDLTFAERYAALSDELHMGVNDALLLQLMLDTGIDRLFSYDKQLADRAVRVGIGNIGV